MARANSFCNGFLLQLYIGSSPQASKSLLWPTDIGAPATGENVSEDLDLGMHSN